MRVHTGAAKVVRVRPAAGVILADRGCDALMISKATSPDRLRNSGDKERHLAASIGAGKERPWSWATGGIQLI